MKNENKAKTWHWYYLRMMTVIFSIFLAVPVVNVPAESLTGRDIMVKADERPDGEDRKSVSRMILVNKRGRTRERVMLTFAKDYEGLTRSLFFFKKPADVKGVGFLSFNYDEPERDDDRWLFLPALKKVRRISGSSKNDYFMGSDFTYDDMGGRSVDEDTHRLLGEEPLDGSACWKVESVPRDKGYMYSKVNRWIAKDSAVVLKAEFFDRQGKPLKTLRITDVNQVGGFWTVFRMEMENYQEKHKTIIEIDEMKYDSGLKDRLFKVSTLERGRIK